MAKEQDQLAYHLAQLQAELERANCRLVESHKMASLGRLLAAIAHEINTPVGSISSNSEVMLRSLERVKQALAGNDPSALEKARALVETCCSLAAVDRLACQRIADVVRGLKTLARGDSAGPRRADINEILRNTLKLTEAEFRRRVAVETDFGELPQVECHAGLLSQVFLNLLVNAGQAIEGSGAIRVRTRLEGERVRVSIADTGRGITPDQQGRIFEAGFTTKPVGEGSGLGLPIARQIVEETHGGALEFESQPGAGTVFHVLLPVRGGAEPCLPRSSVQ
jgi:signal transduction histidine kinase